MSNSVFKEQGNIEAHRFLVESELIGDTISILLAGNFIILHSENNDDDGTSYDVTMHALEGWRYMLHHACFGDFISKYNISSYCIFDGKTDVMDKAVITDLLSILKEVGEYLPH